MTLTGLINGFKGSIILASHDRKLNFCRNGKKSCWASNQFGEAPKAKKNKEDEDEENLEDASKTNLLFCQFCQDLSKTFI